MLVLFETPAGYAIFKVSSDVKAVGAEDIWKHFTSPEKASQSVKLKYFNKFEDTTAALGAATAICDSKLDSSLANFLSSKLVKETTSGKLKLGVSDSKLGGLIKEQLNIKCIYNSTVQEVIRGIRSHMNSLITGLTPQSTNAFQLGLSHSLARYKLKFSPDKVDIMIVQAISLLDELDKELNTYAMRVREWYGWHFPEMGKIINDNIIYAKTVKLMKVRTAAHDTDFSSILPEEVEVQLKEAAEVSMGTEIAEEDIDNICSLCDQVITISEYRASLYEYLQHRMSAIAPNLTCMVGELVGARLIAHAGSLLSLAKQPASTVQILGAEKALFRALKTKHDTPKYGLIYHASLVGQAAPKNKGKVSRMLAAKTALAIRMDALGEVDGVSNVGLEGREKVELRLKSMEGGKTNQITGISKNGKQQEKYIKPTNTKTYNPDADIQMRSTVQKSSPAVKATTTPTTNGLTSIESEEEKRKREKKEKSAAKKSSEAAAPIRLIEEIKETPSKEEKEKSEKKKEKKDKKRKVEEAIESPPPQQPVGNNNEATQKEKKKEKKEKKEKKQKVSE